MIHMMDTVVVAGVHESDVRVCFLLSA